MSCANCCEHHWAWSRTQKICIYCGKRESLTMSEREKIEKGYIPVEAK